MHDFIKENVMPLNCEFHPTRPSHWLCPTCHQSFCRDCISERKGGYSGKETLYFCPSCNHAAEWIGASNTLVPFWNRLPKFFSYPFNVQPIILMITLAILSVFFTGPGLFNGLARFVIWAVMLKYAFAAVRSTARGNLAPPKIDAESISGDFSLVFKQLAMFLIFFFALSFCVMNFGPVAGVLLLLFGMLFLPSMIIILISTESLIHAINPMMFVPLAARLGKGYWIMYFFLTILYGAPYALLSACAPFLPGFMYLFIFYLANNYYTLIAYHLMGYVLLQYHREVGYQIRHEDFQDDSDKKVNGEMIDPAKKVVDALNILIKEGKHDEAIQFIEASTANAGFAGADLSERYLNLLKMKKDGAKIKAHAPVHLGLLVKENQQAKACALHTEILSGDQEFLPDAQTLFKIAGWQNMNGKSKEAIAGFKQFIKSYSDHASVPMAFFRIAQIYHDRLMEPAKAKKVLNMILERFPNHEIESQARNYLKQMG